MDSEKDIEQKVLLTLQKDSLCKSRQASHEKMIAI
jgi:hypothetical protein